MSGWDWDSLGPGIGTVMGLGFGWDLVLLNILLGHICPPFRGMGGPGTGTWDF